MQSVNRVKPEVVRTNSGGSLFVLSPTAFATLFVLVCVIISYAPAFGELRLEVPSAGKRVPLPETARYFGVATSWKPSEGKLSLIHEDHRAEILIGSDRLMVDNYLVVLSARVVASDGTVSMPLSDSAELFSRLLGREVTETEISSAGLILRGRAEPFEGCLIKSVRYISYPRFTRLIINVSCERDIEEMEVRCLEGAGTLKVELPRSRFVQLAEKIEVGDRLVELIEPVQTSTAANLIVRTFANKVKYEIQRHDDPPRVVVDIKPAAPTIVTGFPESPILPAHPKGWSKPEPVHPREQFPFSTIVIDPGHGGKDQGSRGRGGSLEKKITLDIALKLKELIENEPGMKVVLTRTGDYFVPLKERTAIANRAKGGAPADLFISIHTNSHRSPKIAGFEAYYISDAIDPSAEATAALENAAIEFERDASDPLEALLTPILWDLQFTEFVSESSEFAFMAQRELSKRLTTRNRGVRQAQFIVLAGVAMPSILVEVGFISNRVEEAKLKTAEFKNKCAEALAAAAVAFKERYDMKLGLLDRKSHP
ncbi:MAG: N-acetylmuramoyl-L-alanine amidase [Candidatus Hydrogenedentota bacterium]|nr:MAG: N-acetylmuramoyl-L-alanine amidase [Candidatus Hydrogenedentota bacterium]